MARREIHTSVMGLSIPGATVRYVDDAWVRERQRTLVKTATLPENVSSRMLAHFGERPIRQAYFRIRGRSYFLDFFFPSRMLAIEIDGAVHRFKKDHDRRRDADFRSIGIRTIRIGNKDVMEGRLYEKLFKRLYR